MGFLPKFDYYEERKKASRKDRVTMGIREIIRSKPMKIDREVTVSKFLLKKIDEFPVETGVKPFSEKARREILLFCSNQCGTGSFGFNTSRMDACVGSSERKRIRNFIEWMAEQGHVVAVARDVESEEKEEDASKKKKFNEAYSPSQQCRQYQFTFLKRTKKELPPLVVFDAKKSKKQRVPSERQLHPPLPSNASFSESSLSNSSQTPTPYLEEVSSGLFFFIDMIDVDRIDCGYEILVERKRLWDQWCIASGNSVCRDINGETEVGFWVRESIGCIDLDNELIARKVDNALSRSINLYHGRCYSHLTNMGRDLRRTMRINGEKLVEVDVHACYFALLASMMDDSEEKDRIMTLVAQGVFYDCIIETSGLSSEKVKQDILKDLLFARGWYESEIRDAFKAEYPELLRMIERSRSKSNGSEYAKSLMCKEGVLMIEGVYKTLIERKIHALPLHDGVLCGESNAAEVKRVIEDNCRRILGFIPMVKVKLGN